MPDDLFDDADDASDAAAPEDDGGDGGVASAAALHDFREDPVSVLDFEQLRIRRHPPNPLRALVVNDRELSAFDAVFPECRTVCYSSELASSSLSFSCFLLCATCYLHIDRIL